MHENVMFNCRIYVNSNCVYICEKLGGYIGIFINKDTFTVIKEEELISIKKVCRET